MTVHQVLRALRLPASLLCVVASSVLMPGAFARAPIAGPIGSRDDIDQRKDARGGPSDDPAAWVERTLQSLTMEQAIGQLIVARFESTFTATESDKFAALAALAERDGVGGFVIFGGTEPAPAVLLNPTYGTITLGDPFEAASLLNRLQRRSRLPLLNAGDFETGVGFRLAGATAFPRAMAFGAAGDERLAFEAGRITAREGRAIGVHVNFAPVVDVNNNARNPVINTRSFGEDPARVGALASAYVRGLTEGGMIATLKHFPGHGDTDVDTHLGLATVPFPRERLDRVELAPFRTGIASGAPAVMVGHLEVPSVDATPGVPATFSRPITTGLLRGELGFSGLIYTDSLLMDAVAKSASPGEVAVMALRAGNDVVLDSADDRGAIAAIKAAVDAGTLDRSQVMASVRRVLAEKARLRLHAGRGRFVDLEALADVVGARAHQRLADEVSQRAMTLIKDDRRQVPLGLPRTANLLYLSLLDYPSGWRIGAPSRTFLPELKKRWPNVTAVELSDHSTEGEIDLVRAMLPRYDAVIASVFVRTASFSGRMDLSASLIELLRDEARLSQPRSQPFVTVFFGSPYAAMAVAELPAQLLTYDFYDRAEASAVRAIAGEAPIGGHLPVALPGLYPVGHGLERSAAIPAAVP
ncbi:MAG: glycoside hydrolase family 3 protein [Vicinamibacterales bacterium]